MTTARLRTWDGTHFVHAQGGGGGVVDATAAQAFRITPTNPRAEGIYSGSTVNIRAANGMHLCALNGGGSEVVADRPWTREWETFRVEKTGGGTGQVGSGDTVSLRTYDGTHYLCAEGGGGHQLNATRTWARQWETFTIELYPNHVPVPPGSPAVPTVGLDVRFSSRLPLQVPETGGSVRVARDVRIVATATGTGTDGGVAAVRVRMLSFQRSKGSGDLGQTEHGTGGGSLADDVDEPRQVGDLGAATRSVAWSYDFSRLTAGWDQVELAVAAEAESYGGDTARASLVLRWP